MGLRLLKVNFPWLGLVGLVLGVTLSMLGSLLGTAAEETMVASVPLLRPGLVGVNLSGVVGETRPWMVLETRAETVTKLRSGDTAQLCGLAEVMELSEDRQLAAVRCGFVPFSDTSGGVFLEPPRFSAPFTVTPGDVAAGEEGLGVPDANDLEAPGWTGGRGARYLTLAGLVDWVGEACSFVGDPAGIGGAGDLTDFGLGVSGLGCDGPPEAWGLRGPEKGCGSAERSAGRLRGAERSVWSPKHLLSSRTVYS